MKVLVQHVHFLSDTQLLFPLRSEECTVQLEACLQISITSMLQALII